MMMALMVSVMPAEAKTKKRASTSTTRSTAVMFMGKPVNTTAREMRDHLVNNKGFEDLTGEVMPDTVAVGDVLNSNLYYLRGNYAGYDNSLVVITNGTSKLLSLDVRVNAGRDTEDDNVYFTLLGLMDKVYGKHQFGYDEYKKTMEKYESILDDETIEAKYLGLWKKPGFRIYIDYATSYYPKFENSDDSYVKISFNNIAEFDRLKKRDQQRRISNM